MSSQARSQQIVFSLTSHGLGHLTRSLAVAGELRRLYPGAGLTVATTVPEARVALDLSPPFAYRSVAYEPGTLQRNCFELDLAATRAAYRRFLAERDERLRGEVHFLRQAGATAVVSDVPALPIRAAAELRLPAVGLANFTWDWILEPLLAGSDEDFVPDLLASDYARGLAHLRLPFGPDTSPFPISEPAPLVSRRARLDAPELRRRLGIPDDGAALVVVCPGGWDPVAWSPIHAAGCEGFRFLVVGDLPVTADAPLLSLTHDLSAGIGFPDLVAAAEAVLAKPGYGIASECVAHRTALVSIERPDFRETPLLVEQLRGLGPSATLSLADFFAGRWEDTLRAALASEVPWAPIPADGTRRVAERLGELLGLESDGRPSPASGGGR